jgi:phosphoenolpyruvate-protein kinase (PTS system EI component)
MELDEFSMAPASIPLVKDVVRCWSLAEAKTLVEPILQKEDAKQVIAFLGERVKKRRS